MGRFALLGKRMIDVRLNGAPLTGAADFFFYHIPNTT